jgi:hypothetical protein
MSWGLLENKKASVKEPRTWLRPDIDKRSVPSRLDCKYKDFSRFIHSIDRKTVLRCGQTCPKTAKLNTFLDVSSLETPSSYWYNEHCKYKRTILDHSHAFHK